MDVLLEPTENMNLFAGADGTNVGPSADVKTNKNTTYLSLKYYDSLADGSTETTASG
ncbi:MAG: hypothetical protein ACK5HS_00015 [Mycoplasmatales bacterium]